MGSSMNGTEEKILILTSREICYNSHFFFAHQIADAFEKLGYEVEFCEFTKADDFDAVLRPYLGKTYKLMLDFNSLMPQLIEADGTPVLNLIHGPFYDYILDHPLFHYNCLSVKAADFHAILLDEGQEAYVKRYHPNVKSTIMMPLGATEAFTKEKKTKIPECVLFIGSYDEEEKLWQMIEAAEEPLKMFMKEVLERRMEDAELPMECAFEGCLTEHGIELDTAEFAFFMNRMYPADAFVRNYYRRISLEALLKAGIPVKLVGGGWEKYRSSYETLLIREKEVEFALSFEKIAKEHILLNNSPIFNRGAHDRIYAGMANHCVVMTDDNPYLRRTLRDGEQIMLYSLKDVKTIKDKAEELLTNPAFCRSIQEAAYQEFQNHHTWECRARQLLADL